jgi:alpha-L-fucosidase
VIARHLHSCVAGLLLLTSLQCKDAGQVFVPSTDTVGRDSLSTPPIEAWYPVPSRAQLDWQDDGLCMMISFGMNTFTGSEIGSGNDSPLLFNPTSLDAAQWVRVAQETGFRCIVLTVKHADGFCLWPSNYTDYSVRSSPYKSGKGDIVREFADACHQAGMKFGFYVSPWDKHEPSFGTADYNTFYQNQLIELLTNYGEIEEVWLDGTTGTGTGGKSQLYDWGMFYSTIRYFQPNALIACSGPDIRWIGNETGVGNETEWSPQQSGAPFVHAGTVWYPSECDVSIRPGWFYHAAENGLIKTVRQLTDTYIMSVGRNSNLLLGVPPGTDGLISALDEARLRGWKAGLDMMFGQDVFAGATIQSTNTRRNLSSYFPRNCIDGNPRSFWTTDRDTLTASITVSLDRAMTVDMIRLEEAIAYGQRIKAFSCAAIVNGSWVPLTSGTTIGRSRILSFPPVTTSTIRLSILDSYQSPTLRTFSAYLTSP